MKWFFQTAAVGFVALVGTFSLYGQGTSATGQGTAGTQGSAAAEGTATGQPRGGVNAAGGVSGRSNASGQGVDARVNARQNRNTRSGGFFPDDNEPWFANDSLRDQLELDDDQIERLRDVYNQTRSELQGRNSGEQLSDEARADRMRELRNQFDDQFGERSADIFRNENQRNRFNQLGMQHRGYSAFDNPRLQRELNLNETQLRQMRDLNNSWNTELETLRGTYAGDRTGTEQRFNQLRDRTRTNFEGILNDQQRTAYDEMIGDRFDFGADAFMGSTANQNNRPLGTGNQGSGLGTPQGGFSQGSGLGTPQGGTSQGSGLGTTGGTNDNAGGTGAGASGTGSGASGSGAGSGGAGGAGGSGSGGGAGGSGGSGGSGGGSGGSGS